LMRHGFSIAALLLALSSLAVGLADGGCWDGFPVGYGELCCQDFAAPCFNESFTYDRCCGPNSTLPMSTVDLQILYSLHVRAGGHKMYYAVIRIPEVRVQLGRPLGSRGLGRAVPGDAAEMLDVMMGGHQIDSVEAVWPLGGDVGRWVLHEPVRSLFLCLPSRFRGAPRRTVARVAFDVAEKTLPLFLRPATLVQPLLYFADPFDGMVQKVQHKSSNSVSFGPLGMSERQGIVCVSGACDTLWASLSSNSLPRSRHAKIVVDVGCNKRSFAMEWLDADSSDDRWVIALEPDPDTVSQHPGDTEVWMLKVDAQGHELDVIRSAGSEIHRVRQIIIEISDIRSTVYGNQKHPRSAPYFENALPVLTKLGFVLNSCRIFNYVTRGLNCDFVRADLVGRPSDDLDVYNEALRLSRAAPLGRGPPCLAGRAALPSRPWGTGGCGLSDGSVERAEAHEELTGALRGAPEARGRRSPRAVTFQKGADQVLPGAASRHEKFGYTGESSVQAASFKWQKKEL
ncbi:unnamed protein product, partial [Prorocentrum cordatum]